jgi:elongation factor 1-gamma
MADLRIFSYLPNPRLAKATIAARYSGASVEIVGAPPTELVNWLWDYDAHELTERERTEHADSARTARTGFSGTLYKTDAFLEANPFGDIPAAFGDDGAIGVFESNSIMRAAARLGPNGNSIYGGSPLELSRIDGFLDRALIFARDAQRYLLSGRGGLPKSIYEEMTGSFASYVGGVERALSNAEYIASDSITLADIAFACELCLFSNERNMARALERGGFSPILSTLPDYPRAIAHLRTLSNESFFAEDLAPYFERLVA